MARMSRTVKNVERDFLFTFPSAGEGEINGSFYVDMMQCHSLVNRIFARQGMNVLIDSIEIGVRTGGAYTCSILRLPQNWACLNAWTKTMALWNEQQKDAASEAGLESTYARYRDFKINFDADHVFEDNLVPAGFDPVIGVGEQYQWVASQVVIPNDGGTPGNTTERELHMIGPDDGVSAGMIHAYAQSRSRPFTPDPNIVNATVGGLFGEMFDVGMDDEEIVDNFQDRNREPPYPVGSSTSQEFYPGGEIFGRGPQAPTGGNQVAGHVVDTLAVNANQNYNSDATGSFVAPCGLLKFEMRSTGVGITPGPVVPGEAVGGPLWMRIRLAPGYYQGIAAQPMQEVN